MVPSIPRSRRIGEVSEAELLKLMLPRLKSAPGGNGSASGGERRRRSIKPHRYGEAFRTVIGPGDDAALVYFQGGHSFISTDTLVEGYDFRRVWPCGYATSGYDVGWKSIVQNVADISAMGAVSAAVTLAVSLPLNLEVSWAESFADGAHQALEYFSSQTGQAITVVGGDLSAADRISVTTTILGIPRDSDGAATPLAIRRNGVQAGDIIAVSQGCFPLGAAHVGLSYLEAEGGINTTELFRPQLRPAPDFGAVFNAVKAHAMIDTSDGLVHELGMLLESSAVNDGFFLQAKLDDMVLTTMAEELARRMQCGFESAIAAVLSGGEDHLLVACFAAAADVPSCFTPIGVAVRRRSGTGPVISEYLPYAAVFDHFYQG